MLATLTPKAFANLSPGLERSTRGAMLAMLTPKAFANLSPGLERSDNPGIENSKLRPTLKGLGGWRTLSGLCVYLEFVPRGSRGRSNPGLKLANAFGVMA